jgi:hypothetical protein
MQQTNILPGLSDKPVSESVFLDSVNYVTDSLNWNACMKEHTVLKVICEWGTYSHLCTKEQIAAIFTAYMALEIEKNWVLFDANQIDSEPIKALLAAISKVSGQNLALTTSAMKQLYWASQQGNVPSMDVLDPRTAVQMKDYRPKDDPGIIISIWNTVAKATGDVFTAGMNVIEGAAGGIGGVATLLKYLPYILVGGIVVFGVYAFKNPGTVEKVIALKGR